MGDRSDGSAYVGRRRGQAAEAVKGVGDSPADGAEIGRGLEASEVVGISHVAGAAGEEAFGPQWSSPPRSRGSQAITYRVHGLPELTACFRPDAN